MKKMFTAILFCIAFVGMSSTTFAQKRAVKMENLELTVSATCKMCKDRIEKAMAYEKGVKTFDMNVETQTLKLTYDPKKTSSEKIQKSILELGHDVNGEKGDAKAFAKLPDCCKTTHKHGTGCSH